MATSRDKTGPLLVRPTVPTAESVVRQRASAEVIPGSEQVTDAARAGPSEPSTLLCADSREVLDEGLDDALSMLHADRGNIQIVDPASGALRIVVQICFTEEFLEYFTTVDDDASACGRTAHQLVQTVIADVNTDADFAPHREIAEASGFRAVESTPLVDAGGQLVGVVSGHHQRPHRPSDRELQLMQRFGELMGEAVEACEEENRQAPAN
jgi:GAF domain-containing protein